MAFALLILVTTSYYSQTFVVGLQSTSVEVFSAVFIPLLALLVHFVLLSFLPFYLYVVVIVVDYLFLLGIATSHAYHMDNLDVHTVLTNWREGLDFADYGWDLLAKQLALTAAFVVALQAFLAKRLTARRINRRVAAALSVLVIPALVYALHKEPIRRAALSSDYALCIKLYGYYSAMLADLVFSGIVPSQEDRMCPEVG